MTYGRKTGGREKGTPNKRTALRRKIQAGTLNQVRSGVPICELNMVNRLQYASDYFFAQAEKELQKGDDGDIATVHHMIANGALWAKAAAPYLHPKLAAMQIVEPAKEPRYGLDLSKLNDEELWWARQIAAKAAVRCPDEEEDTQIQD